MQEIIKYCDRAIYLRNGILRMDGKEVENVVFAYETETRSNNTIEYDKFNRDDTEENREEHNRSGIKWRNGNWNAFRMWK